MHDNHPDDSSANGSEDLAASLRQGIQIRPGAGVRLDDLRAQRSGDADVRPVAGTVVDVELP
jgi:hypothetical protein